MRGMRSLPSKVPTGRVPVCNRPGFFIGSCKIIGGYMEVWFYVKNKSGDLVFDSERLYKVCR